MQYLPGQTVAATFLEGNYRAFELSDIISVVLQVAEALSYVHHRGLLHLDVKPSNVMYHEGHATLIDFSVAKRYSPERPLRDNAGTRQHMAPEQTRREEIGYATDVFGLGVLFYELLTGGERPYTLSKGVSRSEDAPRRKLDYGTAPQPPDRLNRAVPEAVGIVAVTALALDARERFATALDFSMALLQAARGLTSPTSTFT